MMNLKEARLMRGWTQNQLAEAAGVKQATISDMEKGKIKSPSVHVALRISSALRVSLKKLFPAA